MDEGSWLSWFIIFLLLLFSSVFSTAETAFASVSRIKLKTKLERGDRRAKRALYVLDNFDKTITTILIGNNIVNIVAAALITVNVRKRWGLSVVGISAIITALGIYFACEMIPKSIGKKYSCKLSLSLSSFLYLLMNIFSPLTSILTSIGQTVAKMTRGDFEVTVTEDELFDIIENMKDEGELDAERGNLVHSALLFDNVIAESIVTPRVDVAAIDIETPVPAVLSFVKASKHSRFPVYEGNIDNIIGVLQIRRFIKAYLKQGDALDINSLLDDIHFAHQSTKIDELLSEMSKKRLNMAVITDNYGGTLGIVTVEDILEELVGDIWDEDDDVKEFCVLLPDGSFELDPELGVEESFDLIDFKDPDDFDFENKLLGEWVFEHFDRIPIKGDNFIYNGLLITVSEMKHNRIVKVNARLLSVESGEGGHKK